MTKEEIALQLTLKAMECGRIAQYKDKDLLIGMPDKTSRDNMKLVCDVFKSAMEELDS